MNRNDQTRKRAVYLRLTDAMFDAIQIAEARTGLDADNIIACAAKEATVNDAFTLAVLDYEMQARWPADAQGGTLVLWLTDADHKRLTAVAERTCDMTVPNWVRAVFFAIAGGHPEVERVLMPNQPKNAAGAEQDAAPDMTPQEQRTEKALERIRQRRRQAHEAGEEPDTRLADHLLSLEWLLDEAREAWNTHATSHAADLVEDMACIAVAHLESREF